MLLFTWALAIASLAHAIYIPSNFTNWNDPFQRKIDAAPPGQCGGNYTALWIQDNWYVSPTVGDLSLSYNNLPGMCGRVTGRWFFEYLLKPGRVAYCWTEGGPIRVWHLCCWQTFGIGSLSGNATSRTWTLDWQQCTDDNLPQDEDWHIIGWPKKK